MRLKIITDSLKKGNVYDHPRAVAVIQGNIVGHFPQNMSGAIVG